MGRRRIKKQRNYAPEKMTILEGVLFKESGAVVQCKSAAPGDERYRRAYHQMHLRRFKPRGVWPSDGEYMLIEGVMAPVPDVVA